MKRIKSVFILLFLISLVTGCSSDLERYSKPLRSSDYGSLKAKKAEQSQLKALNVQEPDITSSNTGSTSYSSMLAKHVSSIPGVGDARVFTVDEHAYVALVLDYTGQGMLKSKQSGEREIKTNETPLTAQPSIHNNPFRFFITVNDNSQLSERFIRIVSEAIQAKQPSIQQVHISANKDFMYYMDEFAQVAWAGESLEPYAEQFNTLISHQFYGGKVMPTSLKYYRNR